MAEHDYALANASGASFRTDANNALSAIVSQNSKATAPSTTFAYQIWYDTTANILKIRNAADNAWISLFEFDQTNNTLVAAEHEGQAVASASSCDIWNGDGRTVHITGTTNIDDFGTAPRAGAWRLLIFDGALTVNDSATIDVNAGANWTSVANNMAIVYAETTTTFKFRALSAGGKIAQVVNVQDSVLATSTDYIIRDDTIPQNTEGHEFITLAITPTNASSKLKIDVNIKGSPASSHHVIYSLYQDMTADALVTSGQTFFGANNLHSHSFTHYMTAGTTSATTFKVRIGTDTGSGSGSQFTFNGAGGSRNFGGVYTSSITITEILP